MYNMNHMEGVLQQIIPILTDPRVFGPILYALVLFFALRITSSVYKKFKRRKSGFGTVFNSMTGQPIDLARVRLVDVHGLTTTSAVTDKYGHYRLSGIPGEFTVDVSKPGYTFPSVFLKDHDRAKTYDNVLPSRRIKIRDHGIITVNIPLDPQNEKRKRSKVFRRLLVLGDNTQLIITYASPILAAAYPFLRPTSIPAWGLFIGYVAMIGHRITHFTPGKAPYGSVREAKTGEPIENVVIRLFDAKFNKLLNTQITSGKGRYAMLVNRGAYYMTLKADGYKPVRLNFPHITKDSYPLATDVKLKKM